MPCAAWESFPPWCPSEPSLAWHCAAWGSLLLADMAG